MNLEECPGFQRYAEDNKYKWAAEDLQEEVNQITQEKQDLIDWLEAKLAELEKIKAAVRNPRLQQVIDEIYYTKEFLGKVRGTN